MAFFLSELFKSGALYGWKPGYFNQLLLLAEMEVDEVLEAVFITTNHSWPCPSYKVEPLSTLPPAATRPDRENGYINGSKCYGSGPRWR